MAGTIHDIVARHRANGDDDEAIYVLLERIAALEAAGRPFCVYNEGGVSDSTLAPALFTWGDIRRLRALLAGD